MDAYLHGAQPGSSAVIAAELSQPKFGLYHLHNKRLDMLLRGVGRGLEVLGLFRTGYNR